MTLMQLLKVERGFIRSDYFWQLNFEGNWNLPTEVDTEDGTTDAETEPDGLAEADTEPEGLAEADPETEATEDPEPTTTKLSN